VIGVKVRACYLPRFNFLTRSATICCLHAIDDLITIGLSPHLRVTVAGGRLRSYDGA